MTKQLSFQDIVVRLGIDVPVTSMEQDELGGLTLHLYGGGVRHWPPTASVEILAAKKPPVDPKEMSLAQLRLYAKKKGIPGWNTLSKHNLRAAVIAQEKK